VEAFERHLAIESEARQEDGESGKLALARTIAGTGSGGEGMPRLVAASVEDRLRRRYGPLHIASRVAQVDELLRQAEAVLAPLRERDARVRRELPVAAPWMPPALAVRIVDAAALSVSTLEGLVARLEAVRAGFAALPVDSTLSAAAPEPLRWADEAAA